MRFSFEFLIFSIIISLTTFFIRAIYRILNKGDRSSDAWAHLYFIDLIRKNGHRPPSKITQFLTTGFLGYPIFVHWLLSFFDKRTTEKIEPFFGALVDSIHNLFLFSASIFLFEKQMRVAQYGSVAFIASMIFAVTPMLVKSGARVFSISMRPVGGLLFSITTFFLFEFYWTNDFRFLVGAVLIASFIFLSSKFAVQVLVIFYFFFTLIKGTTLLLVVLAGFLLALLFSLGQYLRVFKGHINHLSFYAKTLQFKHPLITHLTSAKKRRNVSIIKEKLSDLILLVQRTPTLKMMAYAPFLFLWIISLVYERMYADYIFFDLSLWVLIPIVACLFFSIKYMRFLGEPERYMEYSIFPLSILSAYCIARSPLCSLIAIPTTALSFVVIFYNYRLGLKNGSRSREKRLRLEKEMIDCLKSKTISNILPIPQVLGHKIAYLTHHNVLAFSGNLASTPESQREFNLLFPITYPMINTDLERIVNLYRIDLIVVEKKSIYYYGFHGKYDFSKFSKELENDSYAVYGTKEGRIHTPKKP